MWEVGAARRKLLNGNLSGNLSTKLSHGDTRALRKTKRRVSKSGSAPALTHTEDAQVGSGQPRLSHSSLDHACDQEGAAGWRRHGTDCV